jgi:hypothetical protein
VYDGYPGGAPVVMRNLSGNEKLFENLHSGDIIKIIYSGEIAESYPAQTTVFEVELVDSGSIENIPQDIYDQLSELGWHIIKSISAEGNGVLVSIEEWSGESAEALELIYEDDNHRYYLSSIRSANIMLVFDNSERISLKDAIEQQKVSIEELLLNGLQVYTESNSVLCDCDLCQAARLPGGVTPAGVQIHFILNEIRPDYDNINEYVDISPFADYYTFTETDWTSGMRTLFSTDITVNNFQFLTLAYSVFLEEMCCDDYCSCIFVTDALYTLNELTPEMPLVAEWNYVGCFTSHRGISFEYDGVARYFDIIHSNYNGHLFLREFEPRQ